jgi:two-component system response regulator
MAATEILLIDADGYDAELTLESLRDHHLANRVLVIRSGREALEYLRGLDDSDEPAAPLLILLDLRMAGVGDTDVLAFVRSSRRLRHVPVVLMLSSPHDLSMLDALAAQPDSTLLKPVQFDALMQVMARLGYSWGLIDSRSQEPSCPVP